ncbi:MAG: hypothetical protein JXA28_02500 [Bacteroidetes bacterium]|nr:hypothetical protein [Bacteroidota bacterium]
MENSARHRILIRAILLPLAAGAVMAAGLYLGSLHVWGGVAERILRASDTTRYDEVPRYLGAMALTDSGGALQPYALAFHDGRLHVSYINRSYIDVFERDFDTKSSMTLQQHPRLISGFAVEDDRLYIADPSRGCIQFYHEDGRLLDSYAFLPDSSSFVPHGICCHDGVLYVTDTHAGMLLAIAVRSSDVRMEGELLFTAGGRGQSPRLVFPAATFVTPDGRILVSDLASGCVQVYTCNGRYAVSLTSPSGDVLRGPHSIAMDDLPSEELLRRNTGRFDPSGVHTFGRIHVVDRVAKRVAVFDALGTALLHYGGGELQIPNGIAIDTGRRLIVVADAGQASLVFYRY